MIGSFKDKDTKVIFERKRVRKLSGPLSQRAFEKLLILDAAERIDDLRIPPGNRLEDIKGKHKGQYSIRINDKWRICFHWKNGDAFNVEICDYH